MNKKGFTLIEIVLVVIILGIISIITIPSILEVLGDNKRESGEDVEKLLIENLKAYNLDYKEDLWCIEDDSSELSTVNCDPTTEINEKKSQTVKINDLYKMNPYIDMGECLLQDENSLTITRTGPDSFTYSAKIVCANELNILDNDNGQNKILDSGDEENKANAGAYYKTP